MLTLGLVAGCISGQEPYREPPAFTIDDVGLSFEGEWIIVNLTITNRAYYTPYMPRIHVYLRESTTRPNPGGIGEDLEPGPYPTGSVSKSIGLILDEKKTHWPPLKSRYHETDRNPAASAVNMSPNTTLVVEFALVPYNHFENNEGFYNGRIDVTNFLESGVNSADHTTGCFNYNTEEFYGARDDAPDCEVWDSTGRYTWVDWWFVCDPDPSKDSRCG